MAWTQTRDDIIAKAYRMCRAIEAGVAPSTAQIEEASDYLSMILNQWQETEDLLWKKSNLTYAMPASSAYTGTDGLVYRCIEPHAGANDKKPITGAFWERYSILDENATSGGVYTVPTAYTAAGVIALSATIKSIDKAYYIIDGISYPLKLVDKNYYDSVLSKGEEGSPTSLYLDRATNIAYLHPQPDDSDTRLLMICGQTYITEAETDVATDSTERWYLAMTYALAGHLAPILRVSTDDANRFLNIAESYRKRLKISESPVSDSDSVQSSSFF